MRELERIYSKSDRVVAKAKFTYWVFLREFLTAAILGGLLTVIWIFAPQINALVKKEILTEAVLKYILLGEGCFVVLMCLCEGISRYRKEAIITDQKFVSRCGVFSVQNAQLPINEIKAVETHQNMFQRILRYGNLIVITDAESPIVIKWIIRPDKFAQKITAQKTSTERVDNERILRLQLAPAPRRSGDI